MPARHPTHPGVVAPSRVDPAGLTGPTYSQARSRRWRKVATGIYVPAEVSRENRGQQIAEAAALAPDHGGVTGWAALHWQNVKYADGTDHRGATMAVALAIGGANLRPHPGVLASKERLKPTELVEVDGLTTTVPVRSVCFEARYAESVHVAVRWLDLALAADVVSAAECLEYADLLNGWTGVPQLREALTLCDENVWSPPETLMRLVWTQVAGCPRPLCNVPVFDARGRHLGTPDLLDPAAGVVGEYDGKLHLEGAQRSRDVRREGVFRAVGLEYVTMLAGDTRDAGNFVQRLHEAYLRARHLSESARPWTLARPRWWVDTDTVSQRRALTEEERVLWLRRRVG